MLDLTFSQHLGRHPPAVQEHFSKFTDNIKNILWEHDGETGQEMGIVLGMQANDLEKVLFSSTYECRGAVEDWLDGIIECCQSNLREQLGESITAYMEIGRERWLNEFCAQLCITTSQICTLGRPVCVSQ